MKKLFTYGALIVLFTLAFLSANAQEDTTFVKKYRRSTFIKPILSFRQADFSITDQETGAKNSFFVGYRPMVGIGTFIFNIGLEAHFQAPFRLFQDSDRPFSDDNQDFFAHVFTNNFNFDIYRQYYVGFDQSYRPNDGTLDYSQFNEQATFFRYGINGIYVPNGKRLSWKGPINQTARQIKSAGSMIYILNVNRVEADGIAASPIDCIGCPEAPPVQKVRSWNVGVLPGYSYTWVKRNFYINATAAPGAVHYNSFWDIGGEASSRNSLGFSLYWRAAAGYDNGKWFVGVATVQQRTWLDNDPYTFAYRQDNFRIFGSIRFGQPKWALRMVDKYRVFQL